MLASGRGKLKSGGDLLGKGAMRAPSRGAGGQPGAAVARGADPSDCAPGHNLAGAGDRID